MSVRPRRIPLPADESPKNHFVPQNRVDVRDHGVDALHFCVWCFAVSVVVIVEVASSSPLPASASTSAVASLILLLLEADLALHSRDEKSRLFRSEHGLDAFATATRERAVRHFGAARSSGIADVNNESVVLPRMKLVQHRTHFLLLLMLLFLHLALLFGN